MIARVLCYLASGILMLTAAGCDPVVSIAGANFPDWLLCAGAGAILAALCHPLLVAPASNAICARCRFSLAA